MPPLCPAESSRGRLFTIRIFIFNLLQGSLLLEVRSHRFVDGDGDGDGNRRSSVPTSQDIVIAEQKVFEETEKG